ncbi:MAG TPA: hypothetical protein VGB19_07930 [Actinomycetota bacterium]
MLAVNLIGATWLAVHLASTEHEVVGAIGIGLLATAVFLGNQRAIRAARDAAPRSRTPMGPQGQMWGPEPRMPEIRITEQIDSPRPKLGAPGSLN